MKEKLEKITYSLSIVFFGLLALLFFFVLIMSIQKDVVHMCSIFGWKWGYNGNYVGLFAGLCAYVAMMPALVIPRFRHNLNWFMKFTHELTHTLVAILFFAKIKEFVVKDKECYVSYQPGPIGYVPITLSPYCIPIYTIMLFPFRFTGDNYFMIVFDFFIAFTYAFHLHSFIKQTRYTQSDIEGCGRTRSTAFIACVHLMVLSLILATPKGGVMNAISRVFWEYPVEIIRYIL